MANGAGSGSGASDKRLRVLDKEALLQLLSTQPLGSAAVDSTPVSAKLEPNLSFGPFDQLTLNTRADLTIQALSGPEDQDDDGIAGGEATSEVGGPVALRSLPPQIVLRKDGDAWLKYRLGAGVKVVGSGAISLVGFKFAGAAEVGLLHYRKHGRAETVVEAVARDVSTDARFALVLDDVLALQPGECLSHRLKGNLQASVTVSWMDVLATHLGDVLSQTGIKTAVMLKVSTGAHLTASVSVDDDFLVAFTAIGAGQWRVAVKKAAKRDVGLGGDIAITVAFANPGEIGGILQSYLSSILGTPLATIKTLLRKGSLSALSDNERALIDQVVDRLGLSQIPDVLAALKDRVDTLEKSAQSAVEAAATAKLTAGFAYEYHRVSTQTVLFQAVLTQVALEHHHRSIAWGRLDGPLSESDGSVTLERYLSEQTATRTASWGFTLGVDKWTIAGKDMRSLESVERQDAAGRIQRSYLGRRSYTAEWIGHDWSWEVDFNAEMPGFSADTKPKLSEFGYGLSVVWRQSGNSLSSDDIEQLLDIAMLWDIIDTDGLEATRNQVRSVAGQPYEAGVQLLCGPGVFRAVLPSLVEPTAATRPAIAAALAAAMPYWELRRLTPAQRQAAYQSLWAYYLEHPTLSADALRETAVQALSREPGGEPLAHLEANYLTSRTFTFLGLVELNGDTAGAFARFTRGLRSLRDGMLLGEYDQNDRISKVFKDIRAFWAQSHHVRALGAYLLDAASRQQVHADLKRSLTVLPDGAEALVLGTA